MVAGREVCGLRFAVLELPPKAASRNPCPQKLEPVVACGPAPLGWGAGRVAACANGDMDCTAHCDWPGQAGRQPGRASQPADCFLHLLAFPRPRFPGPRFPRSPARVPAQAAISRDGPFPCPAFRGTALLSSPRSIDIGPSCALVACFWWSISRRRISPTPTQPTQTQAQPRGTSFLFLATNPASTRQRWTTTAGNGRQQRPGSAAAGRRPNVGSWLG